VSSQATGTFSKTPLPQVLVFLRRHRLDGTLVIENARGEDAGRVHFVGGLPACIEMKSATDRLGELLVIRGLISAKTLASSLKGMKERGLRLGRYLVEEGHIGDQDLRNVMEFQIERRLALLYPLSDEAFTFNPGENLTTFLEEDMTPVDPMHSMPRMLRDTWSESRLDGQLERLRGQGLLVTGIVEGDPYWYDDEREALASIEGRTLMLDEAMSLGAGRGHAMRVVLYVLMLGGGIEITGPGKADDHVEPRPLQPAQDPRILDLKQAARRKLAQIEHGNLFAVLEVTEEADLENIRASYIGLVKKFHPDTVSGLDDESLRDDYLAISTKLREAFDTLTDPEKRASHIESIRGGPTDLEEQAIVQQVLNAEIEFQKASILARKKKWKEACDLLRPGVEAAPENGEYLALLAWAKANLLAAGSDLTETEATLRRALSMAPRSEKANYYLAQILKRSGKEREALPYLREVVSQNPHNIDIKRELRILEMRFEEKEKKGRLLGALKGGEKTHDDEQDESGGTLGKLRRMLTKKL